ncbi:hypothetical protein K488DRAFT_85398 [Vararia minispora EC-137]|uniref:Uncharacterized protein n=1 Tax=Vararia minispora EC-137 TaxID=1314806 RepID=A0ACB8QML4_9AGAM|nr:hypothetical protein K488DRAFT_85398 [Vararia minispora EC-137]
MINSVVNLPNRVIERQKAIQASHKPLWYRLPRSNIYMGTYKALFALGMVGNVYCVYSLIRGKQT